MASGAGVNVSVVSDPYAAAGFKTPSDRWGGLRCDKCGQKLEVCVLCCVV